MEVETRSEATPVTSGKAVGSLVFAILGIVGVAPCIGPILGIVLGRGERSGVGRAGVILGWIALGLQAVAVLLVVLFLVFGVMVETLG